MSKLPTEIRWGKKLYVTSGSKLGGRSQALDSIERLCDDFKMIKAFEGILATRKPTKEDLAECRELGKKLVPLDKIGKPQRKEAL